MNFGFPVQGVEVVDNEYFITKENVGMLKLAKEAKTILVLEIPLTNLPRLRLCLHARQQNLIHEFFFPYSSSTTGFRWPGWRAAEREWRARW